MILEIPAFNLTCHST